MTQRVRIITKKPEFWQFVLERRGSPLWFMSHEIDEIELDATQTAEGTKFYLVFSHSAPEWNNIDDWHKFIDYEKFFKLYEEWKLMDRKYQQSSPPNTGPGCPKP